ncbi:MAG: hydroxylamine reductase [Coriobacteriaceae bacterium]|nr:hydroxylamine reductase [Coriobacteriaceae bacterium]
MDEKMFCFQCEQTAGCTACTGAAGVCGKPFDVALAQDELTGALVGLARTCRDAGMRDDAVDRVVEEGLFACVTNVDFDLDAINSVTERVRAQKARIAASAGATASEDLPMSRVWTADEDIRSLKSLVLFGIRGMAAYAYHARMLGKTSDEVGAFFVRALAELGDDLDAPALLSLALGVGEANLTCMALLDGANTGAYGTPAPTEVPLTVERGPFIVITGHDLHDLELLLEQTDGRGINVYTHGEMLPAHAYPLLKAHPQLKGNFGTAWQNQQREFDGIPAPVLFTTNCLMPPRASYADRVFTTELVAYPGIRHVGASPSGEKDFSDVIDRAIELGGYAEDQHFHGINGGSTVTTGFSHGAVLSVADKVVSAVRTGELRHFFLVGGCDGAKPGRNYYTEFVRQAPKDSIVLTLACGKYRFNDLDLGTVAGLPRIMDVGQCNDAYGAIQIAVALANAFGCGVNDLPLSFVLSWYEQKAVCILLTLLHLGIKGIRLGPTLPAFVSPNVLDVLVREYGIAPVTTPEEDLATLLA